MLVVIKMEPRPDKEGLPNVRRLRNLFSAKLANNIKEFMYSGIFKHPTGRLAASIQTYVVGNNIVVYSDANYAEAQDKGVKPHIMWHLVGKVIPLRIHRWGFSQVIFRRVTLKSILEGKWRHPGYEGKHFVREGLRRTRLQFPGLEMAYDIKEVWDDRIFN